MADSAGRKIELIAELDAARARITPAVLGLRRNVDVKAKAKRSFHRHRFAWLGAVALVGLLITLRLRRRPVKPPKEIKKQQTLAEAGTAGILMGLLKIILDFSKPMIVSWATKQFSNASQAAQRAQGKARRPEPKVGSANVH